ncbi:MAG: flagellar basal body rod protein FlgB [Alphaproteobacteria bacterium]|nr:flagellar basal body rod protein FlgB [Alphaproteobacteria bacterium]
MNGTDIPLLGILRERMSWLHARQAVLSQNVANADSPGYAARDLKPVDFDDILRSTRSSGIDASNLRTTNTRHIAISQPNDGFEETQIPVSSSDPSNNTVSLEEEMIKVADTQAQYQAAANLYSKAISLMRLAIGKPQG